MSLRQSGNYIDDGILDAAAEQARMARYRKEHGWDDYKTAMDRVRCRLCAKISLYFDGTGNNLYSEQAKQPEKQAISNVGRLFLANLEDKGQDSFREYVPGVGTNFNSKFYDIGEDKGGTLGLAFGKGGEMRLQHALRRFAEILDVEYGDGAMSHIPVIQVNVFGFSRGATLARAFVLRLFKEQCEITEGGAVKWKSHFGRRVPLELNFLGLFDTVASVGGPGMHADWAKDLRIPTQVKRCVHLVSAHEVRQAFPLDSIAHDGAYPNNSEEVIYPGVHSDVGGGYYPNEQGRSNDLAKIPLREMYFEALKAGVPLLSLKDMDAKARPQFYLSDDTTVDSYIAYREALTSSGGDLVSQIRDHRIPLFKWRSALARSDDNTPLLSGLIPKANCEACLAAPEARPQFKFDDKRWKDKVPEDATEQGKQLVTEQKRLIRQIEFIRNPYEGTGQDRHPRAQTDYEKLILSGWDSTVPVSDAVAAFLANHVHDSVAHFSGWPCALYDPREIFLHRDTVLAQGDALGQGAVV
ncbi:hypothetical protein BI347_19125 [Chromobacterium sphagni]|uniref:T6SS Phospholipase effector Tle1-like catalytic domain-containing protein n=1 Tax=Chromobacterium sphagni TaxID=1903179 RepID=A0A1S1WTW9_9NEIS|nr:DUF2235 domain-containing protein [Chromobacterium sphagni]OHX10643.1 hypothetical protein BI347_19125 [Chromobacterium sphagni]